MDSFEPQIEKVGVTVDNSTDFRASRLIASSRETIHSSQQARWEVFINSLRYCVNRVNRKSTQLAEHDTENYSHSDPP
jgi:hypothetical protein